MSDSEEFLEALKPVLFQLIASHFGLTREIYRFALGYEQGYQAYKVEQETLDFLKKWGLLDEFMMWGGKNES